MKKYHRIFPVLGFSILLITLTAFCQQGAKPAAAGQPTANNNNNMQSSPINPIPQSEEEWKKKLNPEQYYVLREKGTERAFTGKYWDHHEDGTYRCAGCGFELFSSEKKFDSGCGWPSFSDADSTKIIKKPDYSHGMIRTEVMCANCGGHLGHLFDDGPTPTGLRYCINSVSIDFQKKK
jgi:peptide-methionine (R)-S-oxide reductase